MWQTGFFLYGYMILINADFKLFELTMGGFLRPVDFIYKETGVNRQLRAKDDDIIKSSGQILYIVTR